MKSLGIDPSTYTGLVLLDREGNCTSKLINFSTEKGISRVHLIAKSVRNLIIEWKPDIVTIEGYAYGNKHTLVLLVEIGTAIRLALHEQKISWVDVPPTKLKSFVTGKGNAKKVKMAECAKILWGFESKSDDIIDAYCLAKYGLSLNNMETVK